MKIKVDLKTAALTLTVLGPMISQAAPACAANAVSRAIARAQPCRQLKTTKLGVTIGDRRQ